MTSEYGSCNGKDMHDVRGLKRTHIHSPVEAYIHSFCLFL